MNSSSRFVEKRNSVRLSRCGSVGCVILRLRPVRRLLAPTTCVDPAHDALYRHDGQRSFDILRHRHVDGVAGREIEPLQELRGDGDLAVRADLERPVRWVHPPRLRNLVDFVAVASLDELTQLLEEAKAFATVSDERWLLRASELSGTINRAVLSSPERLAAVREAVQQTAAEAGCELIVGASEAADHVVRGLTGEASEPSRALLFDFVRVTGAAFTRARAELRHIDVVPAVLVDLRPGDDGASPRSISLREVIRG